MSEELNKQLATLAAKLGVSVEHLWGVLIKQAFIDGLSSLLTVVICAILAVATVYAFLALRRKFKTPENTQSYAYSPAPTDWMLLGVVLLVIVAVASNNFYWVISDFFNPEYYALRQLPGWSR
jgi:hypothetical protein